MVSRMLNTVCAKRSEGQQGRSVWSQALGGLNSGSVESELVLGIIQQTKFRTVSMRFS